MNPSVPCLQSRLYGELPGGHQFNGESVYIFTLASGGDQIVGIQEFIDTKLAADFAAAAAAAAASAQ